jgi:hypothetical protein
LEPVPHDFVQALQLDQLSTAQSFAQLCTLQSRDRVLPGHARPLCIGSRFVRFADCVPLPQDLLQVVHADHSPTTQLTGQLCMLHTLLSVAGEHALPPLRGCRWPMRERACVPLLAPRLPAWSVVFQGLHVKEHAPHGVNVLSFWQSTGQSQVLQSARCVAPGHALPLCMGCVRLRLRT